MTSTHPMTEPLQTRGSNSRDYILLLMSLCAFSVFRLPPWLPYFVTESSGVDPSWQMFLHEAVGAGWRYGSDVLFTYGPLGFLHTQMYHPETWSVVSCVWIALAVISADFVWRVTGHGSLSPGRRALIGCVVIECLSLDVMAFCFGMQGLLYLDVIAARDDLPQQHRFWQTLRAGLPIVCVAAFSWAKFSYLPTVCLLVGATAVVEVGRRHVPVRVAVLTIGMPVTWFVAGGTLNDLGGYLTSGLQLAGGYGSAMGLGPTGTSGNAVIALSAIVVLLVPLWMADRIQHRSRGEQLLTWLFFSGLLFVVWKSAFVRFHPGRFSVFLGTILSLGVAGWSVSRTREHPSRNPLLQAGGLSLHAVLLLLVVMSLNSGQLVSVRSAVSSLMKPAVQQARALATSATEPDWRLQLHQTQLEAIRQANPIPPISGSVDVFPSKLGIAFSHDLTLSPRPVIQSYAAFTPALIQQNGQHFHGVNAPDRVLFSVSAIDGRLPALEDPRVWFELADRYSIEGANSKFVQLVQSPPRGLAIGDAVSCSASWGETVPVPDTLNGPVWCRVVINPAQSGKLAGLLYRLPELQLDVTRSGLPFSNESFRLIPASAASGFLLSPVIATNDDAIAFWKTLEAGGELQNRVQSIACHVAGPKWATEFFESEIHFEFSPILISEPAPASARLAERRSAGSVSE